MLAFEAVEGNDLLACILSDFAVLEARYGVDKDFSCGVGCVQWVQRSVATVAGEGGRVP